MTQIKLHEIQTLNAIRDEAAKYDIAISHRSRINAAQRLLSNCQDGGRHTIDRTSPDFPAGLHALRDAQQLLKVIPVVETAQVEGADRDIEAALTFLCGPITDCRCMGPEALSRLLCAAILLRGGGQNIQIGEFSLRVELDGKSWELSVVRVSDYRRGPTFAREAVKRKEWANLPLAVCLDCSDSLCPYTAFDWFLFDGGADRSATQREIVSTLESAADLSVDAVAPSGVQFVFCLQTASYFVAESGWQHFSVYDMAGSASGHTSQVESNGGDLVDAFDSGITRFG